MRIENLSVSKIIYKVKEIKYHINNLLLRTILKPKTYGCNCSYSSVNSNR